MLPRCRTEGDTYAVPKFDLTKRELGDFVIELKGFHEEFRECFTRSEPRENFFRYMVGQFSELERKSIEPIALAVEDADVRCLQRFVSKVTWDERKMLEKYRNMVEEDLGDAEGVLIFDESAFAKKGEDSVGVARQYCGALGKVENCQVGVFMAYASPHGYALLDKRLFIPEKWFEEEYAERRKKCELPPTVRFKTKPQLAVEMFEEIQQKLPFKYVVSDTVYGTSPEFIEAVEHCIGVTYLVGVPSDILCWLRQPMVIKKHYRYRGELHVKEVLNEGAKKPITVQALAKSLNNFYWYRRKVSEGTKGPIEYEFTKRRVVLSRDGLPDKEVWLLIRRSLGKDPKYSYYISNASVSTRLKTFVWLSGIRWAIEQCFEEAKTELGMDHYEVRKYAGWNHHLLTCMLGHFFLWHLKIRLGKKSTSYYAVAA
jgi:SRSO17 transposase